MGWDHRKPTETGKSGKITYPDTRKRTIVVDGGEYAPPSFVGLRTKPQGSILRFDPDTGIQAICEASELSIHTFAAPQNPTDVTATATGSATVDIGATVSTGGNDGVEIYKSTTSGSGFTLDSTVEETAFPVEISGLTAATTYYFKLRSFLYDGEKKDATFTAEVSATTGVGGSAPSAIASVSIAEISRTATTMTLEATWADVADETSYEWWAGANDGSWSDGSSSTPNPLAADSVSVQYVATRQNADHSTFFCARPCNASGCAEQTCNSFTVAGNLTAPSGLAATNPVGSDVDLDWTDMVGASVADVTAVERRLVGGTYTEIDTVAFGTTHYDDNALADGDYEYRVRHRDTGTGDVSPYSASDSVGINSGGGGSSYPNEPAGLTAIGRQGWSNATVSSPAVESDFTSPEVGACSVRTNTLSRMEIVSDGTSPAGSGKIMRGKFPDGMVDGISPWRFDLWGPTIDVGGGSNDYEELYISYWLKVEGADFENQTVGTKTHYVAHGSTGRANHSTLFLEGTSTDQSIRSSFRMVMYIYENWNADGTDKGGGSAKNVPNLTNETLKAGQWVQIEQYMKVNTITGSGWNADGIFRQWVDGVQTHELTDIEWRTHVNTKGFYHFQFTPVWGGSGDDVRTRDDYWRIAEVYQSGVAL